jgi:Phosphotransferase enzyme family
MRRRWEDLPVTVRRAVQRHLGTTVLTATSQTGGFTDGVAARVDLGNGERAFLKAIPHDHELIEDYRTEARIATALPDGVPASRLRFDLESDGYFVLGYDDVDGRHPDLADAADLRAVITTLETMSRTLTPNPVTQAPDITVPLGPLLSGWSRIAEEPPPELDGWSARHLDRLVALESRWITATAGDTLLHCDLRHDNLLITADGTAITVDWAWACVGADWVEAVYLLPAVAANGGDPQAAFEACATTKHAEPAAVNAFICALAGFYLDSSRQPAPNWSCSIRAHERHYRRLCRDWLRVRTGWP